MIKNQSEESASESNYPYQRGKRFLHCKTCLAEKPPNISPAEYGRYNIGFTEYGIEIWCMRHDHIVGFFNLYDIWSTVNLLKDIQGVPSMPVIEVDKETIDGPLIYTGIEGVFVDPFAYGSGELIQRLCSTHGIAYSPISVENNEGTALQDSLIDEDDSTGYYERTRQRSCTEMKKYIVTATYVDQYHLDFNPNIAVDWWIRKGTLYVRNGVSAAPLEFSPVVEFDGKYPDKVEVRFDEATFDDE